MLPNVACLFPRFTNAVQSPNAPYTTHAFAMIVSTNCPMVMRDGNACGFTIKSGRTPSAVNGISFSGIMRPTVPFWPHRDANLSPMFGARSSRMRTLAMREGASGFAASVMYVLSTYPICPFFGRIDASTTLPAFLELVTTWPMRTLFSVTIVFSRMRPFVSKLL